MKGLGGEPAAQGSAQRDEGDSIGESNKAGVRDCLHPSRRVIPLMLLHFEIVCLVWMILERLLSSSSPNGLNLGSWRPINRMKTNSETKHTFATTVDLSSLSLDVDANRHHPSACSI